MRDIFVVLSFIATLSAFADDVFDGRCFFASRSFTAATQDFVFTTGWIAPRLSMSVSTYSTGSTATAFATVDWYGSVSFDAVSRGTLLTSWNARRDSGTRPTSAVTHSPLALTTTGTTAMPTMVIPAAIVATGSRAGFWPVEGSGWLLKANTQYWFRVTPSVTTSTFQVKLDWKE